MSLERRFIAGWSSLAARRAHNPKVVGSNPTPATIRRHSSAGQSIRFIPEVSCVRITLPLPKKRLGNLSGLSFFAFQEPASPPASTDTPERTERAEGRAAAGHQSFVISFSFSCKLCAFLPLYAFFEKGKWARAAHELDRTACGQPPSM